MKLRNIFIYFTGIFVFLIASCQSNNDRSSQNITVTIQPLKYFASRIAGNQYSINVLLPAGANHETWEPTPLAMANLSRTGMLITIGPLDFETILIPRISKMNLSLKVVNTSKGIVLIGHQHTNGKNTPGNIRFDPHTWLSPKEAKIIAGNIYLAIRQLDTLHSAYYQKNYEKLRYTIDSVDNEIQKIFSGSSAAGFMIFHPALAYFANDYGLSQISIENDGKEPSPFEMSRLVETAKKQHIRLIFVSKEFDVRNAQTIAGETGARIVTFEPLSEDWPATMIGLANQITGKNTEHPN